MQIRKCQKSELPLAWDFYDRTIDWLKENDNLPKWEHGIHPTHKYIKDMVESGSQYICCEDDSLIGAFVLNDDPEGAYQKGSWSRVIPEGEYLVIHALAISNDHQGHGIGSRVISFCIDVAKSGDFKAVRLDLVPGNVPAQKLYEKNGFTYVGDEDLDRGNPEIPFFSLYELNL